ncbi:MAG: hypothetical protein M1819_003589 [Sarea resinae]|nr:MAG: hypothetical protein M1819_003589 [Sarea resinae]
MLVLHASLVEGPLKPGPKIGASQRSSKRARRHERRRSGDSNPDQDINPQRRLSTTFTETSPNALSRRASLQPNSGSDLDIDSRSGEEYIPLSPEASIPTQTPRPENRNPKGASAVPYSLPESTSMNRSTATEQESIRTSSGEGPTQARIFLSDEQTLQTCYALHTSPDMVQRLIIAYFDNMTSFSLFSRPQFEAKLAAISSPTQRHALLAAMFSFAARFEPFNDRHKSPADGTASASNRYLELALSFIDQAINESADEAPTLCLLQALILTTFQQLMAGVRGKSWRSLGICVRIAYELKLHLIDTGLNDCMHVAVQENVSRWCADEERRRAWWAIWECDVLASTVRRIPTAIDWTQNETLLPVDDQSWFAQRIQPSCFLELDPIDRWKSLQRSGNQSAKAWLIVVTSFMRDAHVLVNPFGMSPTRRSMSDLSASLEILANSLRCFTVALPRSIAYRNEYLSFTSSDPADAVAARFRDSAKHGIYMMTQMASWLVNYRDVHVDVFKYISLTGRNSMGYIQQATEDTHYEGSPLYSLNGETEAQALGRYADTADKVCCLVSNSSEDHVRYVNPIFSTVVWIAASVQLVYKTLGPEGSNRRLIETKFDLLRLNYRQYVTYWNSPKALDENLDDFAARLQVHPPRFMADARVSSAKEGFSSSIKAQTLRPVLHDRSNKPWSTYTNHSVDSPDDSRYSIERSKAQDHQQQRQRGSLRTTPIGAEPPFSFLADLNAGNAVTAPSGAADLTTGTDFIHNCGGEMPFDMNTELQNYCDGLFSGIHVG